MTSDPWEKVLRTAVEECLDWHKADAERQAPYIDNSQWWIYGISPWKIREIMRDRAISMSRYDEVLKMIQTEFSQAQKVEEIKKRLTS